MISMFKFIFRVMTVSVFLVFLTIGLVIWKGGEPFKVWGRGLCIIGERISDFGEIVDKFIDNSDKFHNKYEEIRDVVESDR
jgi:hypothetical protein